MCFCCRALQTPPTSEEREFSSPYNLIIQYKKFISNTVQLSDATQIKGPVRSDEIG